ncbi:MAG: hypothetical protein HYW49_02875 [Deltaproteobacteria bacterium]|nr:hypothetical protein [Deltaproteobacteria bacterium]
MRKPDPSRRKKWTRKTVIEELRAAENLSAKHQQGINPKLYGAAVRHFGSWRAAVEAAGFKYQKVVGRRLPGYWNRERCIKAIDRLSERHSSHVRRQKPALYSAALRIFGSWQAAIEAAGYDYQSIRKGWVDEWYP